MVTCTSKVFLVGRKDNRQFRKTNAVHFIQFVDEVDYQQQQPHLYQGSSNPGRSFKVLQSMTQPENAGEFQPWVILIITIRCQTTKKWLDQTYWTMNEEYACVERINENLEKLIAIASISWKFTCTLHSIACYLECLDLANCQTIVCTCNDDFQTKYLFSSQLVGPVRINGILLASNFNFNHTYIHAHTLHNLTIFHNVRKSHSLSI